MRESYEIGRTRKSRIVSSFFYDAPPYGETETHPISGEDKDFSASNQYEINYQLLQDLELKPKFAVRRGELDLSGWKLGQAALKDLSDETREIESRDLIPDFNQSGVDMRIGLDVAWIALKNIVDVLVLVTGDSDFIPAMKMARKEGLEVYLDIMEHGVFPQLKAHSDRVIEI